MQPSSRSAPRIASASAPVDSRAACDLGLCTSTTVVVEPLACVLGVAPAGVVVVGVDVLVARGTALAGVVLAGAALDGGTVPGCAALAGVVVVVARVAGVVAVVAGVVAAGAVVAGVLVV